MMQSAQTAKIPLRRKMKLGLNHLGYSIRHMRPSTVVILILLTAVALVSLLPIVYVICNAFKPLEELFVYPPRFFVRNPTTQNFTDFMYATDVSTVPFSRYLFNSVTVTVCATALTIVFSLCCAYAFSKLKFPGRDGLFRMITIALMFSPEAVVITRYLIVNNLALIDTFWAHILPHLALPMGVFLIKQFMDQVPDSLCEAAKIDGANEIRILWSIITPAVLPAVLHCQRVHEDPALLRLLPHLGTDGFLGGPEGRHRGRGPAHASAELHHLRRAAEVHDPDHGHLRHQITRKGT